MSEGSLGTAKNVDAGEPDFLSARLVVSYSAAQFLRITRSLSDERWQDFKLSAPCMG